MIKNTKKRNKSQKNITDIVEYKTVSDLNQSIKKCLEKPYENIKVFGEISNFKISNKNLFATLKDNESMINIISWGYGYKKNQINISNGNTFLCYGKIVQYPKSGSYCLLVNKFEKIGIGDLHYEYELLKIKYERQGYFSNKKKFPCQINKLGIITALEGAALQDILHVLKNNNFTGKVIIKGCIVQGNLAPNSIANSINQLTEWYDNDNKKLDIIIVARGGGSFEDLIAFSSSNVIEAIHKSNIFIISAVGHEIDYMLSDFVADMRAATPSISAEIVSTYKKNELSEYTKCKSFIENQIYQSLYSKLSLYKTKIQYLQQLAQNPEIKLIEHKTNLDDFKKHFSNCIELNISKMKNNLEKLLSELQKYDKEKMLNQGYSILTKNNRIIDSAKKVKIGEKLKLKMRDGDINILVLE